VRPKNITSVLKRTRKSIVGVGRGTLKGGIEQRSEIEQRDVRRKGVRTGAPISDVTRRKGKAKKKEDRRKIIAVIVNYTAGNQKYTNELKRSIGPGQNRRGPAPGRKSGKPIP